MNFCPVISGTIDAVSLRLYNDMVMTGKEKIINMKQFQMARGHLHDRRSQRMLFLLCWAAYTFTYLGRLNYAACLVSIMGSEGWSKAQAGLIATGFFATYGLGQLVNGCIGDRISPRFMVGCGLGLSGLVNLLFPLAPHPTLALVLWCINGFVQSMIWSPMLRQLSEWLPAEPRMRCCVNMNSTVPVGTLLVYGLSAAFVRFASWKMAFFTSGVLVIGMSVVWFTGIGVIGRKLEPVASEERPVSPAASTGRTGSLWKLALVSALPLCMVGIFMQGMLKDGVTTWIPTFLGENFGMEDSASILCTTIVPIVNLGGVYLASWLNRKYLHNELRTAAVFFAAGFTTLVLLAFLPMASAAFSLLLLAATTTFMMSINTMMASIVPSFFVRYGACSTATGLLNSAAYVGCALSSYGNGVIVERFGWNSIMYCWCVCALIGGIACSLASGKWKRFRSLPEAGKALR